MGHLERIDRSFPQTHSKDEAMQILFSYQKELTASEYQTLLNSLCQHALEGIYLNEKDILLGIAQLRNEISIEEIVELAKVS